MLVLKLSGIHMYFVLMKDTDDEFQAVVAESENILIERMENECTQVGHLSNIEKERNLFRYASISKSN